MRIPDLNGGVQATVANDADLLAIVQNGTTMPIPASALRAASLNNVSNPDFLAKGAASGLAKADVSNVTDSSWGGKGFTSAGANTARTLADRFADMPHVEDFGAKGESYDDTNAIMDAVNAIAARGGGPLSIYGGRYEALSGNVDLGEGVFLRGHWENVGEQNAVDYSQLQSALLLGSGCSIRNMGQGSGGRGIVVLPSGLTTPATFRQAKDMVNGFAGTAIQVGDGTTLDIARDSYWGQCFVAGFDQMYFCKLNSRPRLEYMFGDNNNGVRMNGIYDMMHVRKLHLWPALIAHQSWTFSNWAISGAVAGTAGVVRLTVSDSSQLRANDPIIVSGVVGTTEANGLQTISTVVDATHIELAGTTFANAYVSGGVVDGAVWRRPGKARWYENIADWAQEDSCFSWGYQYGAYVDGSDHVELVNPGVDNYATAGDFGAIGYYFHNSRAPKLIGPKLAAQGRGIVSDIGTGNVLTVEAWDAWGGLTNYINVLSGQALIGKGTMLNYGTVQGIVVSATSDGVVIPGGISADIAITTPISVSGAALRKSMIGPCSWNDVTVGQRNVADNAARNIDLASFGSGTAGRVINGAHFGGSAAAPTASPDGAQGLLLVGKAYDGANLGSLGSLRVVASGAPSTGSTPGEVIVATTPTGSNVPVDRWGWSPTGQFFPAVDATYDFGAPSVRIRNGYFAGVLTTGLKTVATLPSASSAGETARSFVSDASVTMTAGIGTIVAGGGANKVPVYSDGTNWLIG